MRFFLLLVCFLCVLHSKAQNDTMVIKYNLEANIGGGVEVGRYGVNATLKARSSPFRR